MLNKKFHTYRNFEEKLGEKRLVWLGEAGEKLEGEPEVEAETVSEVEAEGLSLDEETAAAHTMSVLAREKLRDDFRATQTYEVMNMFGLDRFKAGAYEKADESAPGVRPVLISALRDVEKVTGVDWDHTTPERLAKIRKDMILVALPAEKTDETDFYQDMFNQLAKAGDQEYLQGKAVELPGGKVHMKSKAENAALDVLKITQEELDGLYQGDVKKACLEIAKKFEKDEKKAEANAKLLYEEISAKQDEIDDQEEEILGKSGDTAEKKTLGTVTMWYRDPDKYLENIQKIDPDFVKAWLHYEGLRNVVRGQRLAAQLTKERAENEQAGLTTWDAVGKVTGKISKDFAKGWRDRDYKLMGANAVAAIAILWGARWAWKTTKFFKPLFLGYAGLTAVNFIANKQLGVDIWKKMGLKDEQAEIKGTPMEPILRLAPEMKKVDGKTLLAATQIHIGGLHEAYEEAVKDGTTFIPPEKFPMQFPDFARPGASGKRFKNDERYEQTGKDLFLIMQGLIHAYQKVNNSEKAVDFATLMYQDKQLSDSLILDFAADMLDKEAPQDVQGRADKLLNMFKESSQGALTRQLLAGGFTKEEFTLSGEDSWFGRILGTKSLNELGNRIQSDVEPTIGITIMGLPFIVREDKVQKRFFIFDMRSYEPQGTSSLSDNVASIPFEGQEAVRNVEIQGLKTKIAERAEGLLEPALKKLDSEMDYFELKDTNGKLAEYKDGQWKVKYQLMGESGAGIEGEAVVVIKPPFQVGALLDTQTGVDLKTVDEDAREAYKEELKCRNTLDGLAKEFGLAKIDLMPVSDVYVLKFLTLRKKSINWSAGHDFEDITKEATKLEDDTFFKSIKAGVSQNGSLYEALNTIRKDDKALFDRMKGEMIMIGSQDFFQAFTKTEGVMGYKRVGVFNGQRTVVIDYNERASKIVEKLREYFAEKDKK
ncbi:MAG: hypothetical protein WC873_02595 [Candidatus Gracilibacteria bacterium]